jgi:phosphoenolpyruvate carboxykinase (GTP)
MLPFCGYDMADYFAHWLEIGKRDGAKLPKVFYVNWFRKDANGKWLWPGFGENSRVLAWIFGRCEGTAEAVETPIGLLPAPGALPLEGLDGVSAEDLAELLRVTPEDWKAELPSLREHLAIFGDKLPAEMTAQLDALEQRLNAAS